MKRVGWGFSNPARFARESPVTADCVPCAKAIFLSRKAARRAARRFVAGTRPRAYGCPHTAGHWHLGHISDDVRQGAISRDEWNERKGRA